ncbi:MAG TPA: hypothetical protein VFC84_00340 [Desulfosporosinus sp.]|nr:hypothetical protein [Desulfosporosinus sp.]
MQITVTLQAPEIAKAIHALAKALEVSAQATLSGKNALATTMTVLADVIEDTTKVSAPDVAPTLAPTAPAELAPATPAPAPATVPVAMPTYSMEQLAVAATQLVDAGRRTELVTLLASFGVQALTVLDKDQYGNFATQLRAMGAKI